MRTSMGAAVVGIALAAAAAGSALAAEPASHASPNAPAVTVRKIPVPGNTNEVAIDSRRGVVWATAGQDVVRISESRQRVVAHVPFANASQVAVDPAAGLVWAGNGEEMLAKISERTNKVIGTKTLNCSIDGLAIDTSTGTMWVSCGLDVLEMSVTTGKLLHTVPLGNDERAPVDLAVDSTRGLVWVAVTADSPDEATGLIAGIKESSAKVIHRLTPSSAVIVALAVDPSRATVWVAVGTLEALVINEKTGKGTFVQGIQNDAKGIAIDPATGTVLFTDLGGSKGFIRVVSEKTRKVTSSVDIGFFPTRLRVDPSTANVYVPIDLRDEVHEFHL